MSLTINWIIEKRIINFRVDGTISAEELRSGSLQLGEMLSAGEGQLVHILFDLSTAQAASMPMGAINTSVRPFMAHPQLGWMIAYGTQNSIVRMMASVVSQVFRARFRSCGDFKEAALTLQSLDTTLPDLQFLLMEEETLPRR